jgi:1-deoxy-D-xylulose-5-phosphate synthase
MQRNKYPLLDNINSPEDVKKLREDQLADLCKDLREFIIDEVCTNPGHFGASLGVVELTVALHYVFKTPYDQIIWDVGHQAYGHKILTGRKAAFQTNRKFGGISGFPKRSESEYDAFGTGHSSTSISAALGIAIAAQKNNQSDKQVIAVIGDGSLTGGMAFEGLNNAGIQHTNLLVILNDNNMAIDPNVGAMKEYLLDITTSPTYNRFRTRVWNLLGRLRKWGPAAQLLAKTLQKSLKFILIKESNLFESLNFRYFGPVDGHDVIYLSRILNDLKNIPGPKLLHIVTVKGKGFKQAELNQTVWHAPGKFNKETGELLRPQSDKPQPLKYQDVFGRTLMQLAQNNLSIIAITPAMMSGSGLSMMAEHMPDRVFDVGIAEQHAVTFSAGLASQGMIPFCVIYSSFFQRAYDQAIHDVALQNLQVVLCLDRAGLVGDDGPTHHGAYDMAFMRCIPNVTISAPMDEIELRNLMYTAQLKNNGPFVIRYPKGYGNHVDWNLPFEELPIGKGRLLHKGTDIAILSIGIASNFAAKACSLLEKDDYSIAHYDMRFLKPLDEDLLMEVGENFKYIITIEDACIIGGIGSAIMEFMNDHGFKPFIQRLGIPDDFIEHGTQEQLYQLCGFDVQGICNTVKSIINPRVFSKAV